MSKTKKLVMLSLLVAIDVILTRHLSIQTELVRITFSFIAIAVSGALFGPVAAGMAAAAADIIGMLLFPFGTYFPGFTLSAFLRGVIYGMFLHRPRIDNKMIIISSALVVFGVGLGLTTLWLNITTGTPYMELLKIRAIPNMITFAVQVAILTVILPRIVSSSRKMIEAH